jgi:hypothetical protein
MVVVLFGNGAWYCIAPTASTALLVLLLGDGESSLPHRAPMLLSTCSIPLR